MGDQQLANGAPVDGARDGANAGPYQGYGGGGGAAGPPPQQQQQHQQEQQPPNFFRTESYTSLAIMDNSDGAAVQNGTVGATRDDSWLDNDDTVPTVFRWEHGGSHVYITGTFNDWSRLIPMHRSGNNFTYIHNLTRRKHAFKFIVDDEWSFAPDLPTVADLEGRINNFIDVTAFRPYTGNKDFEKEKAAAECGVEENDKNQDPEVFGRNQPDVYSDYAKEPPPLPPHLRQQIILNNQPPHPQDTAALPVPQHHVALNHLYCAIRDNMTVLGVTQRYQNKFVTTIYYSPCANK